MTEIAPFEAAQAETIRFLADPATHGGAPVELIVTHISRVFLAGDRAFKLKRAVASNYLDFSTPALREAACRREIEVNAAAGPLYRGVVAVTRAPDGALRIGGDGEAVDFLVEMRRFDRAEEFDRLLAAGRLDAPMVERLADVLAEAHRAAPDARAHGGAAATLARIDQIAEAASAAGSALREIAPEWRAAARAEAARHARLFDLRTRHGCVRRCHGDLHLRNIVMIDGRPTPFDAIEFSEEIASVDILYDLALTLADLLTADRRDLACALLNRWLGALRDNCGLALLPLYLSMRGAVRGMVAASSGDEAGARAEFAFAQDALAPRPPPRLVAIGGISGSGKTTLARALAPRLGPLTGAVVIRSDVTRKRIVGMPPETRAPLSAYAPEVTARVARRMLRAARRTLAAGFPALLDATFLDPAFRAEAEAMAARMGVRFDELWLTLPPEEAARRAAARFGDASDADGALVRAQAPRAATPAGWRMLDAAQPVEGLVADALAALG
ncbi:MAG: AAA family ATPase [Rubrimonas sp.]|uniref:bifunctional aminoglycoside phosphotransferase/ATP-binding protein n=1 Tax=Rubrimonas sp. TaxID=2036015 RepID=UPI002FDCE2B7